jgi:hypothetical protein
MTREYLVCWNAHDSWNKYQRQRMSVMRKKGKESEEKKKKKRNVEEKFFVNQGS